MSERPKAAASVDKPTPEQLVEEWRARAARLFRTPEGTGNREELITEAAVLENVADQLEKALNRQKRER